MAEAVREESSSKKRNKEKRRMDVSSNITDMSTIVIQEIEASEIQCENHSETSTTSDYASLSALDYCKKPTYTTPEPECGDHSSTDLQHNKVDVTLEQEPTQSCDSGLLAEYNDTYSSDDQVPHNTVCPEFSAPVDTFVLQTEAVDRTGNNPCLSNEETNSGISLMSNNNCAMNELDQEDKQEISASIEDETYIGQDGHASNSDHYINEEDDVPTSQHLSHEVEGSIAGCVETTELQKIYIEQSGIAELVKEIQNVSLQANKDSNETRTDAPRNDDHLPENNRKSSQSSKVLLFESLTTDPFAACSSTSIDSDDEDYGKIVHRKLYPELQTVDDAFQPLTDEQIKSLYYNPKLESMEHSADSFLKYDLNKDSHPLAELMLTYYRARNHLVSSEQDIQCLQEANEKYTALVWTDLQKTITAQGQCMDRYKVSREHAYTQAEYHTDVIPDLTQTLRSIRNLIHDDLSLYAYTAQKAKLHVEVYIYNLYKYSSLLQSIPPNAPLSTQVHESRDPIVQNQLSTIRDCISVLFSFLRKPKKDGEFYKNTQNWITRLSSSLLRVGCIKDVTFLLHHLLRCPAGVAKWSAGLIQAVCPPVNYHSWQTLTLDHVVSLLATILLPIKGREECLFQLKAAMQQQHIGMSGSEKDNPWVLVDSDGEEDEDPMTSYMHLQENDIVAFLNQINMADIFASVLYVAQLENGQYVYDASHTSETGMLKLYAFATSIIELIGRGLANFHLGRYRQLNKRLGRMIKMTMCYISDHWDAVRKLHTTHRQPNTHNIITQTGLERLQLEYDQLFLRATLCLLCARRMASWQYLADMPYNRVSMSMRWRLLWLLHHQIEDINELDFTIDPEQCKLQLQDVSEGSLVYRFRESLCNLPTSHSVYLLTMFSNIARSHQVGDTQFVEVVTAEIYDISYICEHTREVCSKVGRELLCSVALEHPYIISKLLNQAHNSIAQVGKVTLYMFRGLPLSLWQPLDTDWDTLRAWLLDYPLSSIENQLAQLIILNLNWATTDSHAGAGPTELFLDLLTQRQMSVLLVETYHRYLTYKNYPSYYNDPTITQGSNSSKQSLTLEQQLTVWCWEVAMKLSLHTNSLRHLMPSGDEHVAGIHSPTSGPVPVLDGDPRLYPLCKAIKEQNALAAYVGLAATQHSHTLDGFCVDGIALFSLIVDQGHFVAAVKILSLVCPVFYQNKQYLVTNTKFLDVVGQLLAVDQSKKGYLSSDQPGPIAKLLSAHILNECKRASRESNEMTDVLMLWISILTHVTKWHHNINVIFIVDHILKQAFLYKQANSVILEYFTSLYQELLASDQEHGVLSSLVSWLSSAHPLPSFIDGNSCADYSWYAYTVIMCEARCTTVHDTWRSLQRELHTNDATSVDQALKTVCTSSKLPYTYPCHRLPIYRWAYQALDMDVDHPLLPLVWQQFFLLYLGRLADELQLPERSSVGCKFFESYSYVSLMKKMKKRLDETSGHHHKLANIPPDIQQSEVGEDTVELSVTVDRQADRDRERHRHLVSFYQTLSFWLDESRLHDPQLSLPALPPQYDAQRLTRVLQNQQDPWLEFIAVDLVQKSIDDMNVLWVKLNQPNNRDKPDINISDEEKLTACERILQRLASHPSPQPPPPVDHPSAPIVSLKDSAVLTDQQTLMYALRADFKILTDYAKLFSMRISKHVALDCSFIELLPSLYRNDLTEVTLSVECTSTFNPTHRCKGGAAISVRYAEKVKDENTSRKIGENRAEYQQIVIESILPPPQSVCSAAVQVDHVISELLRQYQTSPSASVKQQALDTGSQLFYHIASLISDDTKYYTPAEQFLSTCIETLGQEFIRDNPHQSQPLLQVILQTPSLVGLLAPNFSPNASPEVFVTIYEDMIAVPFKQGLDVSFSLLSKLDVAHWLTVNKPILSERLHLSEVIVKALASCSTTHNKDVRLVYEVYRSHFQCILNHQFPDHYGTIMKALINESANQLIHVDSWGDFLSVLGCTELTDELSDGENKHHIDRGVEPDTAQCRNNVLNNSTALSVDQIEETIMWLSSYFCCDRLSSDVTASFGLYPKWNEYVKPLAIFMKFLMKECINTTLTSVKLGSKDAHNVVDKLFHMSVDLYSPWLHTFDNNGQILSPWIQIDSSTARIFVESWVDVVQYLLIQIADIPSMAPAHIISLVWSHYVHTLAVYSTPVHVLNTIHPALAALPWSQFLPDAEAVEVMAQIYDRYHRACFVFVSDIVLLLDWTAILQQSHEYSALQTLHVALFKLLVQMAQDQDIIHKPELFALLDKADYYNWAYIDAQNYKSTVTWFINKCDPRCVLMADSEQRARVLRLLRMSSSFQLTENTLTDADTLTKRQTFVMCVTQLICRCSYLKDVKPDMFKAILTRLLCDTEAIVGTVYEPAAKQQHALTLCSEVLTLLNNCNSKGVTLQVLTLTLDEWVTTSLSATILLPLMSAACTTLVNVHHMTRLIEVIIEAHFHTSECSEHVAYGWGWVVPSLHVPDLTQTEFLTACVQQQCLLTLYAYTIQQQASVETSTHALGQIQALCTWHANIKLTSDCEPKMLLLWSKLCDLCHRQASIQEDTKPLGMLLIQKLVPALARLGEDKATSGFLGAIGLGKKSQLTLKFRVLVRAVSIYIQAQIPSDTTVRLIPSSPGGLTPTSGGNQSPTTAVSPTPQTLTAISQFEALLQQKAYSNYREEMQHMLSFIQDANNSLPQLGKLLNYSANRFYPDSKYLAIMQATS